MNNQDGAEYIFMKETTKEQQDQPQKGQSMLQAHLQYWQATRVGK